MAAENAISASDDLMAKAVSAFSVAVLIGAAFLARDPFIAGVELALVFLTFAWSPRATPWRAARC